MAQGNSNNNGQGPSTSGQGATFDFDDFLRSNGYEHAANLAASQHSSQTVSPQELFASPDMTNSNSLTNLTTPSMYDGSPQFDSFDNSPLFDTDGNVNTYPSLFPELDESSTPDLNLELVHSGGNESAAMERSESSRSTEIKSETLSSHRLSVTSGINKNRRNGRELGPIEVEEGDSKALKRAKNTMAARKSRQKKRDVEQGLRDALTDMERERDRWMHIAIQHGASPPDLATRGS